MIKFAATNNENGLPVLGIGLSRRNCERLLAGQPITFTTTAMDGLPSIEVFIMAGETEETMTEAMRDSGTLDDESKIRVDRSLADPHTGGVQ